MQQESEFVRIQLFSTALLAPMLMLAACGEAPEKPVARKPVEETGATLQVAQLNEDQRNTVFAKAIRASGNAGCLGVVRSERAEMMDRSPGWKAECDNGTAHLIQIMSDGTAKVTSRSN